MPLSEGSCSEEEVPTLDIKMDLLASMGDQEAKATVVQSLKAESQENVESPECTLKI